VATAQPGYATKAGTVRPARVIVADANSQNNESSG
jgi:hypothetical protein